MIIFILEDQYANKIAKELKIKDKSLKIPIKWNIKTPFDYLNILKNINDKVLILLDNYFPGKPYEEPIGNEFLITLLKSQKEYNIICISDRGKRLIDEYDGWKKANDKGWILGWILGWITTKNGNDIYKLIKALK